MATIGELILKTAMDNSGIKKGLKETKKIVEDNVEDIDIEAEEITPEFDEEGIKSFVTLIEAAKEKVNEELKLNPKISEESKNEILDYWTQAVEKAHELQEALESGAEIPEEEIIKYLLDIDSLTDKAEQGKEALEDMSKVDFSKATKEINNVGKSIQGVIKKVARWGVAIFGVRSAYSFVRQAMSTLSQYNEDLANKLSSVRLVLAAALEPIVLRIVSLVETLMGYINYLSKAWFGKDLFARANEISSGLKNTNKQAKELKKTLAGFDEMEILQDNRSNDSNIGGVGTSDFNLKDVEIPKWLEWIKDHGEEIKNIIIGIGIALAAIKFLKLIKWAGELSGLLGGLLTIGIIAIGVELLYTAITGRELISDIQEIIKGFEDLKEIQEEQRNQANKNQKDTKSLIKTYNETAKAVGVTNEITKSYIDTLLGGIEDNNKLIESLEEEKTWYGALNGENKKTTETQKIYNKTIEIQIDELKKLYDKGELNSEQTKKYTELLKKQIDKTIESSGKLAVNSKEYENSRKKVEELQTELERITGKRYDIQSTLRTPDTSGFENKIQEIIDKVKNKFSSLQLSFGFGYGSGGGMGFRAKGGIYYPKLAAGGIINQPGRGVPYHGSIIGERGAEAVLPLTDSQQMALLGEAIGKYININATVPVYVGNRQIAREVRKIETNQNFLTNGR